MKYRDKIDAARRPSLGMGWRGQIGYGPACRVQLRTAAVWQGKGAARKGGLLLIALLAVALPALAEDCAPTMRMPLSESQAIKRAMLPPGGEMRDFELDHIIPLCAGGSNDRSNLQMQPWPEAKRKDVVEIRVCQALRQRRISCAEARKTIEAWKP